MRRRLGLGVAALVGVLLAVLLALPSGESVAFPAAESFLDTYVAADGRVVRPEDGDDTVSEGQAYALLVAASVGDEETFDHVWAWTRENIQRPDGLLAWRWESGRVVDWEPASDADLDTIRALLAAADGFDRPSLREEAARIGASVLESETVAVGNRTYLAAGVWGREGAIVNPSYLAVGTFEQLADLMPDAGWDRLVESSLAVVEASMSDAGLVPDWVRLGPEGEPEPIAGPGDDGGIPRSGLDAARVPFRLVDACDPRAGELAASLWRFHSGEREPRAVHDLHGLPRVDWAHPASLVGAAFAAEAAGDLASRDRLLAQATELNEDSPSYFGSAWLALAEVADRLPRDCAA